jgi:CHASE1-domain containing sensor protein
MNSVSLPAWALVAAAGVVILLALLIVLLAIGARRKAQRRLLESEASEAELRERLEALEKRLTQPEPGSRRQRRNERTPRGST